MAHCTLHTAHCTLHTASRTLHTARRTLHTTTCTLHSAHCTLHTTHYNLHTTCCTLHTAHCTPHTAHGTLQTNHRISAHLTQITLPRTELSALTHYVLFGNPARTKVQNFETGTGFSKNRPLADSFIESRCPGVPVYVPFFMRFFSRPLIGPQIT